MAAAPRCSEDIGDAFDHQVFAEIAVSEKAAGRPRR